MSEKIQPEINLGLVGHVDHGKTTLTQKLSGKWADTHSEELKRGITIRLGYANFDVYKKGKKFFSHKEVGSQFVRKISLVDAPGHESLMATMLSGAMIMDGALLLISANEEFPQPQTREHISALEIIGIEKIIVVQNKVDLVSSEQAKKQYDQIKKFLEKTKYEDAPVIPLSAFHGINVDLLLEQIEKTFPTPKRDLKASPLMLVARSFDINKPGSKIKKIKGGVLGGSVKQGKFKVGDVIEISPEKSFDGKSKKITTKIIGLMTGKDSVDEITPGGSVAILTDLDPSIVKSDGLSGTVVGKTGKLPPSWSELKLEIHLLDNMIGDSGEERVKPLILKEMLMMNVSSAATVGIVNSSKKGIANFKLKLPVCAEIGSRVTLSRRIGNRFRLIGYGIIKE